MEPRNVDLLITDAMVLTFDDAGAVLPDGAIAMAGNSIVWRGKTSEAAQLFRSKDTLRASGRIAMPGLIDCHVHTAQQFLRGKLASLGYKGSLREPMWKRYLIPFESGLEPEDVYCSGLAAYSSMIGCGTTTFLEAGGPCPDEMGRAADEIGIRGRIAMSTMDMDDTLPPGFRVSTEEALQHGEALVKPWEKHGRVNAWLALLLTSVPVVCLIPLLTRIFGYEDRTVFVTVIILCFLPGFVFASSGLRSLPPMSEEYFFVQGAGRWNRLWRLALPAAVPNLAVALRVLPVQSVLSARVAEFLMQTGGLDFLIATSTADLAMDQALAASFVSVAIALTLYAVASLAQRAVFKYYQ